MKNMMSLVRNCNLLLLSILLLSVAGCKKDVNEPQPVPVPVPATEEQTIHGNQPRPSWVVNDECRYRGVQRRAVLPLSLRRGGDRHAALLLGVLYQSL